MPAPVSRYATLLISMYDSKGIFSLSAKLITLEVPYERLSDHEVSKHVAIKGKTPPRPSPHVEHSPNDVFWRLLTSCWSTRTSDRPNMVAVRRKLDEITEDVPKEPVQVVTRKKKRVRWPAWNCLNTKNDTLSTESTRQDMALVKKDPWGTLTDIQWYMSKRLLTSWVGSNRSIEWPKIVVVGWKEARWNWIYRRLPKLTGDIDFVIFSSLGCFHFAKTLILLCLDMLLHISTSLVPYTSDESGSMGSDMCSVSLARVRLSSTDEITPKDGLDLSYTSLYNIPNTTRKDRAIIHPTYMSYILSDRVEVE